MKIKLSFSLIDKMLVFIFAASLNKGAIAQLVEQRTENPCVPGSNPGSTTLKPPQSVGVFLCAPSRPSPSEKPSNWCSQLNSLTFLFINS